MRWKIGALLLCIWTVTTSGQQSEPQFGGGYAGLDDRRQQLVDNWTSRFVKTTGQSIQPGPFYDDIVSLSTKTTFDAVTHALLTTRLTDRSGAALGDALALVDQLETVRGEIIGARGDRQFRMYVRLKLGALDTLARSQEFKRGPDNSVYHKGYPINYRGQGGVPSIQISIALDHRRADIDVDYRSSSFPAGLFNGHLTSSNSDVRAGNNYDRHLNRWTGFQNWWRSFFGVRQDRLAEADAQASGPVLPRTPRAGKANIDVMVDDFLNAWLIEGDIIASMGYFSERSHACLAQDTEDPADFDRGMAPFQLMMNLKSAHDSLGKRESLKGLVVGTRYTRPGLRVVQQPHHAQFVVYSVPDDIAAEFDCESALTAGDARRVKRRHGNFFGATFYVAGRRDVPVALLWAKENGYWRIVSWRTGATDTAATPPPEPVAEPKVVRIRADTSFAQAVRGFLESWLIRKDYDAAFTYMSSKSYVCYDLDRTETQAASTSPEDAGRRLRAALETAGDSIGPQRSLDAVIEAAEPITSTIRVMNHADARVFSLSSIPNAIADAAECAARAAGSTVPDPVPLEYGNAFGATLRFRTRSGDAPVLRLVWRKESGAWQITSYAVELP